MIGEQPSGITHIGKDGEPVNIQLKKKVPDPATGEYLRTTADTQTAKVAKTIAEFGPDAQDEALRIRAQRANESYRKMVESERVIPEELSLPLKNTAKIESDAAQLSVPVRKQEKRGEDNPQ